MVASSAARPDRQHAARRAAAALARRASRSTRSSRARTRPARSRTGSRSRWSTRPTCSRARSCSSRRAATPASRSRSSRSCAASKLTCVMPANATPERRLLLELYGATIVDSPGDEGSNGAVRLAQEIAAARRPLRDALPVRERGEPARALRGHGRRDRARPAARRRARRRPRHRRDADGHRRAPARGVPRRAWSPPPSRSPATR